MFCVVLVCFKLLSRRDRVPDELLRKESTCGRWQWQRHTDQRVSWRDLLGNRTSPSPVRHTRRKMMAYWQPADFPSTESNRWFPTHGTRKKRPFWMFSSSDLPACPPPAPRGGVFPQNKEHEGRFASALRPRDRPLRPLVQQPTFPKKRRLCGAGSRFLSLTFSRWQRVPQGPPCGCPVSDTLAQPPWAPFGGGPRPSLEETAR